MSYIQELRALLSIDVKDMDIKQAVRLYKLYANLGMNEECLSLRFRWYQVKGTNLFEIQQQFADINLIPNDNKLDHLLKMTQQKLSHDDQASNVAKSLINRARKDIITLGSKSVLWEEKYFGEHSSMRGSQLHHDFLEKVAGNISDIYDQVIKDVDNIITHSYRDALIKPNDKEIDDLLKKGVGTLSDEEFKELIGMLKNHKRFDEVSNLVLKRKYYKRRC